MVIVPPGSVACMGVRRCSLCSTLHVRVQWDFYKKVGSSATLQVHSCCYGYFTFLPEIVYLQMNVQFVV